MSYYGYGFPASYLPVTQNGSIVRPVCALLGTIFWLTAFYMSCLSVKNFLLAFRSVWAARASTAASSEWRAERRGASCPAMSWRSSETNFQKNEDRDGESQREREIRMSHLEEFTPSETGVRTRKSSACFISAPSSLFPLESKGEMGWETAFCLQGDGRSLCHWILFKFILDGVCFLKISP